MEFIANFHFWKVLFSRITILDPIMWPYPFQNPNPQNLKIESSKMKTWGLKWSSSRTSMLKGAFVLQDYYLRPHHVALPLPKSKPQNLKIESSKMKTWGLKWSSSPTSQLKGARVLQDYYLRPHHVALPLPKSKPPKSQNWKFQNENLGSKMEFISNFTLERCICSEGLPS